MTEYRTFTEEEHRTLDSIYARNCENLTAEEIQLLIAWETQTATRKAEFLAEQQRLEDLNQAEMAQRKAEHDQAMENLQLAHEIALAKLAAIRGDHV